MAYQKFSRGQAAAHRSENIEAAQHILTEQVAAIRGSDDWHNYLAFQSRLHGYSANNVMLIFAQHEDLYRKGLVTEPHPTWVASYRTWQQLGRQVERGQHGLAIYAPMRSVTREAVDADGNRRRLERGSDPNPGETLERNPSLRGFTIEKVFAETQTSGEPLPEQPRPELLHGQAPVGLGEAVLKMIEAHGFTVSTAADARELHGANGVTTWPTRTVQIRADMDDAAMVKTLIHEAAHVLLHHPGDPIGSALPRGHKEVEAESVAFLVAHTHGMPTDEYSFPYVAAWAGQDHDKTIQQTATRVAACAREIIAVSPADHAGDGKGSRLAATTRPTEPEPVPAEPDLATAVGI